MARSYRELIVWQKAMLLAEAVYSAAALLPDVERYGLNSQLRRAAVSVPSNIAEGYERRSRADYARFLAIACGSVAELETQIELASRLYSIEATVADRVLQLSEETGKLLRAIIRKLRESAVAEESAEYDIPKLYQPSALSPQPR